MRLDKEEAYDANDGYAEARAEYRAFVEAMTPTQQALFYKLESASSEKSRTWVADEVGGLAEWNRFFDSPRPQAIFLLMGHWDMCEVENSRHPIYLRWATSSDLEFVLEEDPCWEKKKGVAFRLPVRNPAALRALGETIFVADSSADSIADFSFLEPAHHLFRHLAVRDDWAL